MEAQAFTIDQPFHGAYEKFIEMTTHLSAMSKGDETHSEIEAYLETDGRELLRLLLQEHLDNQAAVESQKSFAARTAWFAPTSAITWRPAIRACLVRFEWPVPVIASAGCRAC